VLLTGLSQRFLGERLEISPDSPGRGTILEVKEERGLGATIDVILFDGRLKKGDTIAIGGKRGTIFSTVRAILKPRPLEEIRDPKFRFNHIPETHAASGIKIAAPKIDDALAGSQLYVVAKGDEERVRQEFEAEQESVAVKSDEAGVVVKADTIGILEAMIKILSESEIPIRIAAVGDVSKRDVIEAAAVKERDKARGVVLAFNVSILPDAQARAADLGVHIIENQIIYKIIEDYEEWVLDLKSREKKEELDGLIRPTKIRLIPDTVFRQNKPAVIGVEVMEGVLKPKIKLLNLEGENIGVIRGLQNKGESISSAKRGDEVAAAIDGPTIGRQVKEGEVLLADVPEPHARMILKKYKGEITAGELEVLEELKDLKRKTNPLWCM